MGHFGHAFSRVRESARSAAESVRRHIFPNDEEESAKKVERARLHLTQTQRRVAAGAATVAGAVVVYLTVSRLVTLLERRRRRRLLRECDENENELVLFILPRSPWAPSLSPLGTRYEAMFRANGIPYRAIETIDPYGAPNGELPFIVYKRQRVDTAAKMMEFVTSEFNLPTDVELQRDERAVGAALRRTLQYSMERFLYRIAFIDHPELAVAQITRALHISRLRARLAVRSYAKTLQERLSMTAYGALVKEQYENEFLQDCEAVEAQIGTKKFLFNDTTITTYDCAVYSLLVPFAYMGKYTALSPAYSAVADSEVLMGYITRISKELFADVCSGFDVVDISAAATPAASNATEEEEDGNDAAGEEERAEVEEAETKSADAAAADGPRTPSQAPSQSPPSAPPPAPSPAPAEAAPPAAQQGKGAARAPARKQTKRAGSTK